MSSGKHLPSQFAALVHTAHECNVEEYESWENLLLEQIEEINDKDKNAFMMMSVFTLTNTLETLADALSIEPQKLIADFCANIRNSELNV